MSKGRLNRGDRRPSRSNKIENGGKSKEWGNLEGDKVENRKNSIGNEEALGKNPPVINTKKACECSEDGSWTCIKDKKAGESSPEGRAREKVVHEILKNRKGNQGKLMFTEDRERRSGGSRRGRSRQKGTRKDKVLQKIKSPN